MELALSELADKALALPVDERAVLAQQLWDSIEDFIEPGVEEEWLKAAQKRWEDIEKGRVQCIPAEEAMKKARASLNKKE